MPVVGSSAQLALQIPASAKEALARAARKDDRLMSSMARKIIVDWLVEKEFLATDFE